MVPTVVLTGISLPPPFKPMVAAGPSSVLELASFGVYFSPFSLSTRGSVFLDSGVCPPVFFRLSGDVYIYDQRGRLGCCTRNHGEHPCGGIAGTGATIFRNLGIRYHLGPLFWGPRAFCSLPWDHFSLRV